MNFKSRFFFTLLACVFSFSLYAQESCTEKLFRANSMYESGKIDEAIELANTCTDEINSDVDRWKAYRLLALAYLAKEQQLEARKAVEKMLDLNPTYVPSKLKDPAGFVKLIKRVKVIPKFSLGLAASVGLSRTLPNVTATFNATDYNKEYTSRSGWQLGLLAGYSLNEIITIRSGLFATSKRFGINYVVDDFDFEVNEELVYLNLPLYASFQTDKFEKVKFHVDAGIYSGRLMSSNSSFKRTLNTTSDFVHEDNKLNSFSRRNKWEYGSLFGAGAIFDLGKFHIAVDTKYYASAFANLTNESERLLHEELIYGYYYMDDDLRLNNLSLSISIITYINYMVIKK